MTKEDCINYLNLQLANLHLRLSKNYFKRDFHEITDEEFRTNKLQEQNHCRNAIHEEMKIISYTIDLLEGGD